jgi:hypothetical protein
LDCSDWNAATFAFEVTMRLKLFAFIAGWLAVSSGWGQVIIPTVDTFAHALQTATATPNSVIQVNSGPITEQVNLGQVNTSLTIQGANKAVTWARINAVNLAITNALTHPVTIKNITMWNSSTNASNEISWNTVSVGANVDIENCNIIYAGGVTTAAFPSAINFGVSLVSANELTIKNCFITQTGIDSGGGAVNGIATGINGIAGGVLIQNCLITGFGNPGIDVFVNGGNNEMTVENCIIAANGRVGGSQIDGNGTTPVSLINCLVINPAGAIDIGAACRSAAVIYNGLSTNPGSLGISNITNVTLARELSDRNNFWLSPASQTMGKGLSIIGLTQTMLGLNGILQGYSGLQDIGCNPYSFALVGGNGSNK